MTNDDPDRPTSAAKTHAPDELSQSRSAKESFQKAATNAGKQPSAGQTQNRQLSERALPLRSQRPHPVLEPKGPVRTAVAKQMEPDKHARDQALAKELNERIQARHKKQRMLDKNKGKDDPDHER